MKKLIEPAIFAVVGVAASLVHIVAGIMYIEQLGFAAWQANVLAFLTAFPVSYLGHAYLTFSARAYGRATPMTRRSFGRFLAVAGAGFAINQTSVVLFAEALGYPPQLVIPATVIGVAGLLFLAGKIWAFRGHVSGLSALALDDGAPRGEPPDAV